MTASLHRLATPAPKLWEPQLVEHAATYAAWGGYSDLLELCNDIQAGTRDEADLFSAIREDAGLADWCAPDQWYRTRNGVL